MSCELRAASCESAGATTGHNRGACSPELQPGNRRLETRSLRLLLPVFLLLALCGCGYHTAGRATLLPSELHSIAVPAFQNTTNTYHIEQVLTESVAREFLSRTRYRVVPAQEGADATLRGTVTSTSIAPVTYDSQTGRASTAMVTVSMKVSLVDSHGKVLYNNDRYTFREQYQISIDPSSFFQEEGPAMERLSRDFARTLVSNVLEAY